MHRPSCKNLAAARLRWLADLTAAIDEAQRVLWRLSEEQGVSQALDVWHRLEHARAEVDKLRRSGWADQREGIGPEWIEFLPESLRLLAQAREP